MRRHLIALVIMGAAIVAACHKDTPTPAPTPEPPLPQEGVFDPTEKISHIVYPDNRVEIWLWEDGRLAVLADDDNCGGYTEHTWFGYTADGRLDEMSSAMQGVPYAVKYTYQGGMLSTVTAGAMGMQVIDMQFVHNSQQKINSIHAEVDPSLLNILADLVGKTPATKGIDTKLSASDAAIDMQLEWAGDNVARQIMSTHVNVAMTLGELREWVDVDEMAGAYATLLALIPDTTTLPLEIVMRDTVDYDYDTHHNPMYGYLGELDVTHLSAANVLLEQHRSGAQVGVTFNTMMGALPLSFPMPVPGSETQYEYEYNESGYPTVVTSGDETVKTYSYQEL